ncbi:hypothetical protein ONZ51_g10497 [Trametes cubensis]|uniref:Uncharacterized protein n=1 Tax=Trametes cubensis TaxID=1111947 RepID=A0AAD7TJW7_9APHY|nr:hypothetical protein ONZ51_g10497 [Trametes cubensis]
MPDLLGLTTSPQRSTPPFSCHHDEPICDDSEQHESEDDQPIPPMLSAPHSPSIYRLATHGARDGLSQHSYLPFDSEYAVASSSSPNRHRHREPLHPPYSRHDPAFIPMDLDSSPTPRAVDSDRAEFWPDLHKDRWLSDATLCEPYKPTRMPFYSSRPSSVLLESPVGRQLSTPKPTGSFSGLTPYSPCPSAFRSSRDSFCSSVSQPSVFEANGYNSSLPPSNSSRFSWSGSTSYLVESDEVPQASFSLSPPVQVALQDFAVASAPPSKGCEYSAGTSPEPESNHTAHVHPLIDIPPGDSAEYWQQITLAELLGGALFENANPWNALDEVLHLSSLGSQQGDVSDLLALVETCDTSTAGHDHPPHWYSQASGSPQVDSIYTQPDFTLKKVTSGGLVDERSVEGDARLASTDRVPLERARGFLQQRSRERARPSQWTPI